MRLACSRFMPVIWFCHIGTQNGTHQEELHPLRSSPHPFERVAARVPQTHTLVSLFPSRCRVHVGSLDARWLSRRREEEKRRVFWGRRKNKESENEMIDPSKDKFAYFKDNIQTAEDKVRACVCHASQALLCIEMHHDCKRGTRYLSGSSCAFLCVYVAGFRCEPVLLPPRRVLWKGPRRERERGRRWHGPHEPLGVPRHGQWPCQRARWRWLRYLLLLIVGRISLYHV